MDIQKEQKINADLFKEKIDTQLLLILYLFLNL